MIPPVGPPMIGALMRLPWEAVLRRMLEALHEHGFDDIDAPHLSVLLWPGPDGLRPSDLAARMRVTKQALNYLLGELERLGYLERRPDPDDGRARRIAITDRGKEMIPVIREAVAEAEREWAAELGEERFAQLRELLLDLNEVAARETSPPGEAGA
ncbi:MAG TPA: MarR family transcriptional regulator [Gaiellaceae bacterium]|nr:MarR family transcriptional regulator [Gaiellaceae bacterium]